MQYVVNSAVWNISSQEPDLPVCLHFSQVGKKVEIVEVACLMERQEMITDRREKEELCRRKKR